MTTRHVGRWGLRSLAQQSVEIEPDEILDLVAHPFVLIPPPGRNRAVTILTLTASLRFSTTPYTNPGNAGAKIVFNGPTFLAAVNGFGNDLYDLLIGDRSQVQIWTFVSLDSVFPSLQPPFRN